MTAHAATDPKPSTAPTAQVAPLFPLQDFFRNPEKGYFRLADDGKSLAFMQPVAVDGHPARLNIFVQALDGLTPAGEPRRLTAETERDIGGYFWKGNNTILYSKDFGGDENFHVLAVDAKTGDVRDLTPFDGVRAGIIDDLEDDPEHVLLTHNQRQPEVFDVYRVNVRTGESTLVASNPGNIVGWVTDHQGKVRVAVASDGLETTLLYREKESEPFAPLITTNYRTDVSPLFFSFDNQQLYALSNRGRDKSALVLIDPRKPDDESLVFENNEVDISGASYSRLRKVLTEVSWETDKQREHFFDAQAQALDAALKRHLPGYEVAVQGHSRDENIFIVAAYK